jgi:hypothetical protein
LFIQQLEVVDRSELGRIVERRQPDLQPRDLQARLELIEILGQSVVDPCACERERELAKREAQRRASGATWRGTAPAIASSRWGSPQLSSWARICCTAASASGVACIRSACSSPAASIRLSTMGL